MAFIVTPSALSAFSLKYFCHNDSSACASCRESKRPERPPVQSKVGYGISMSVECGAWQRIAISDTLCHPSPVQLFEGQTPLSS